MNPLRTYLRIIRGSSNHSAAFYLVMILAVVVLLLALTPLLQFHSTGTVEAAAGDGGLGRVIQAVMVVAVAIMVGRALTVRPARTSRRRVHQAEPLTALPRPVRVSRAHTADSYSAAAR